MSGYTTSSTLGVMINKFKYKKRKKKSGKKIKRKKAPKGYHYMPDGKLMKNSAHKRKRK